MEETKVAEAIEYLKKAGVIPKDFNPRSMRLRRSPKLKGQRLQDLESAGVPGGEK